MVSTIKKTERCTPITLIKKTKVLFLLALCQCLKLWTPLKGVPLLIFAAFYGVNSWIQMRRHLTLYPIYNDISSPIENPTMVGNSVSNSNAESNKGSAIAILVSNLCDDLIELKYALITLDKYLLDDKKSDVLLFNEGNLREDQKDFFVNMTERNVYFPLVDFQDFPNDFDPVKETPRNLMKRSKWGYQQMCRFWTTKIWEQPILDNYSTYMRFDTDSCFTRPMDDEGKFLPGFPANSSLVYRSNYYRPEGRHLIDGLIETAEEYISTHNITVKNKKALETFNETTLKPSNNFEVSKISFFRQPEVMDFQRAITEKEPFGVFRTRWGDAPIRLILLLPFLLTTRKFNGTQSPSGTSIIVLKVLVVLKTFALQLENV